MKESKIIRWYYFSGAVFLIFLIYANFTYKNEEINSYNWREIIPCNIGWTYQLENGSSENVKLPLKSKIKAGKTYSLTTTLPYIATEESVLCFKSNHLLIHAYVEGALVYSFGVDERNTIGNSPGNAFCFIPIKSDFLGKEITIEYTAIYNSASKHIGEFLYGDKTVLVTSLIRKGLVPFLLSALVFLLGLVFIIVYISRNKTMRIDRSLFFLGLGAIPMAIWSATETQILQFFIPNIYIIQYITYLSLGLIGVPFLFYFSTLYNQVDSKLTHFIGILSIGATMLSFTFQVFGMKDLPELIWLLHGSLLIVLLYCIVFTCVKGVRFYKNGKLNSIVPSFPMIFLLFCCIIDIVRYYFKVEEDYAKYARIGFIVYILCEGLKSMMQVKLLEKENEQLENLAFVDELTGVNNVIAFKMKCIKLMENLPEDKTIGIVNLKIINLDQIEHFYGHKAMEEIIQTVSKLVQLSFAPYGEIFRVSEEGFAIIIESNIESAFINGEKQLIRRLKNCNQSRADKICISYDLKNISERVNVKFEELIQ